MQTAVFAPHGGDAGCPSRSLPVASSSTPPPMALLAAANESTRADPKVVGAHAGTRRRGAAPIGGFRVEPARPAIALR